MLCDGKIMLLCGAFVMLFYELDIVIVNLLAPSLNAVCAYIINIAVYFSASY